MDNQGTQPDPNAGTPPVTGNVPTVGGDDKPAEEKPVMGPEPTPASTPMPGADTPAPETGTTETPPTETPGTTPAA